MAWKIDTSHTSIEFAVKHMMITTVRGRFARFDGTIAVDPTNVLNSRVEGWIETDSVDTRDAGRDAHLRSADFFDVEKFPRMFFASKRVEKLGEDRFRLVGDLTIKGVTREFAFEINDEGQNKDPWGGTRWGLTASGVLNRKDYGLTWNVALEAGGLLVGEQVKLQAELQLMQVTENVAEAVAVAA